MKTEYDPKPIVEIWEYDMLSNKWFLPIVVDNVGDDLSSIARSSPSSWDGYNSSSIEEIVIADVKRFKKSHAPIFESSCFNDLGAYRRYNERMAAHISGEKFMKKNKL